MFKVDWMGGALLGRNYEPCWLAWDWYMILLGWYEGALGLGLN